MLGGVGWTTKTNGKRCENACEEEEPVPYMKDVQSLVETPVMHKDKTNFQNGTPAELHFNDNLKTCTDIFLLDVSGH